MTRKPWNHVRILIYQTWAIHLRLNPWLTAAKTDKPFLITSFESIFSHTMLYPALHKLYIPIMLHQGVGEGLRGEGRVKILYPSQ